MLKKTPEALMGLDQRMYKSAGDVYYTSLSYSTKGFGISAQYRRINNFQFRTSPLETSPLPSYGALINYLPALTRQTHTDYWHAITQLCKNWARMPYS